MGVAPTSENDQRIIDGRRPRGPAGRPSKVGWDIVDGFARFFNDESVESLDQALWNAAQ